MNEQRQTTLARPVRLSGVGIHKGEPVTLTINPAPIGSGLLFVRSDMNAQPIPARADKVRDTRLATVIGEGEATVSTVEHVMAALAGMGVDNAVIEVDGPETPILDGGAREFTAAIDAAGVTAQDAPRRYLEILEPVEVTAPGKRAALVPAKRLELAVEIIFDAPVIGRQQLDLAIDPASFRAELADAPTFGFIADVEKLHAAGLGRGASLENTVVVDGERVLNPELLARADDFVRHKALDALGDLAMLGHPLLGRYESSCSGHALNHALVTAVLAKPEAWRLTTAPAT